MQEIWKRLIYNGEDYGDFYLVSSLGRIKNTKTDHIRKNILNKNGYYHVAVTLGSNNARKVIKPHRAVACTFIANPNGLPEVNHKDGNKLNNNVDNLEWVTTQDNQIHAVINNLRRSGENSSLSKLNIEQIKYIKQYCIPYDKEFGCTALAIKFGVDCSTISNIIHNDSWKDYNENYELIPNTCNNMHKVNYSRICKTCRKSFIATHKDHLYCSQECFKITQRKTERPSKEELFELIQRMSFVQIGEMYDVSDNAIRKWCKFYDLPHRKQDIKNF